MAVNRVFLATAFACFLLVCVYAQQSSNSTPGNISQTCLGCICEAASGCNTTVGCDGDVCGPFRITWAYWSDSGKPTLNDEANNTPGAYPRCVNDAFCAARAVEGYISRFGQDCNGDGTIDCDDYARIHRLGGFGCSAPLDAKYETAYKNCIQTFG